MSHKEQFCLFLAISESMAGQYIESLALARIPVTPWWPECRMSSMSLLREEGTKSLSPQAIALSTVAFPRDVNYGISVSESFLLYLEMSRIGYIF